MLRRPAYRDSCLSEKAYFAGKWKPPGLGCLHRLVDTYQLPTKHSTVALCQIWEGLHNIPLPNNFRLNRTWPDTVHSHHLLSSSSPIQCLGRADPRCTSYSCTHICLLQGSTWSMQDPKGCRLRLTHGEFTLQVGNNSRQIV